MTYTLWSHERLLGEVELTAMVCSPGRLEGDLHPTADGEDILPIATGALRHAIEREAARPARSERVIETLMSGGDDDAERDECDAADDFCDALNLELRGPNGEVVPSQSIHVYDDLLDEEDEDAGNGEDDEVTDSEDLEREDPIRHDFEAIEEMSRERESSWDEPEYARYHIEVTL